MAQPPPQPPLSPPTQMPPPGTYPPPGGAPPYPSAYPPPVPKKSNTGLIIAIVVVVIVVVGLAAAAVILLFSAPLVPTNNPPSVTFGPATPSGGNVTIAITQVSRGLNYAFFQVTLEKDSVLSSSRTLVALPAYATVTIGGSDFRISLVDANANLIVDGGDSIRVTGDGTPLASGNYRLTLLYLFTGAVGQKTFVV